MAKFKKVFLSVAMLCGLCAVGSQLTTHAAADGLVENFDYSTEEITTGGASNYNIYSKSIVSTELAQEDSLDVLKISHQPGDLGSTGGKIEFRDNAAASSLFNTPGSSIVIKVKFKMNQTEDKSFKLWFGGGDVNSSGKTYNLLRMRYDEFKYQMGTATEQTVKGVVVSANAWHEATFVLYETGPDTQDKVFTYVDNQLFYSADFNTGDDFNGKLTGFNIEWPKGTYSTASNMFIDYISVKAYNGATASVDATKEVNVGDEFSLAPTLTAVDDSKPVSLPNYSVTISDNTKLEYNSTTNKFTALAKTTDPVTVTFDFADELIEDKTVSIVINETTEPIKVASITQKIFEEDITLGVGESFNLNHLFAASPITADNTELKFEVIDGLDFVAISDQNLTATASGTAKIKVSALDGSNVTKEVNVKVLKGAYTGLNNYELTDEYSEAEITHNGFISKGYGSKTFSPITVVEDEVFGKAIKFSGVGGKDSSGSHLDKHIPLSQLNSNKDFKLTAWIKMNEEAAEKLSSARIDLKLFTYYYENGQYDYGKVAPYSITLQNVKSKLVNGWVYVETGPINLDVDALGKGFEGIKIELATWNTESGVESYITHLNLVEQETVQFVDWSLSDSNGIAKEEYTLNVTNTLQLNAVAIPSAAAISASYSSSDETIATVDANGLVTILNKVGDVTITVTVGTTTKEITIHVTKSAQTITVENENLQINLINYNPMNSYNFTVTPADHTSEILVSSANEEVCTVSIARGKLWITPVGYGTTTITLVAKDNSEATVTFTITVRDFTVSYDVQGHGEAQDSKGNVVAIPEQLPELTAEGWIFGGWYLDAACTQKATAGASITADTTLYAKWTEKAANTYTITYNTKGHGEAQNSVANVTAIPEQLPELTAEGWTFGGWYTDEACTVAAVKGATITADTTLYAKWTEVVVATYTITYNIQGHGTAQGSVSNVTALPSELPVLSEEGYTFDGWYLDANCTQKATAGATITADTTLYAKWTKNAPKPVTPEPTPKKDNTGLIVGLVVGGVVLLGAAGGLAFYLTKKGKASKKQDVENKE